MPDDLQQFPFAGGPNEAIDPRLLPPGSVIAATNQVYDLDGSYKTRFGYTVLSPSATTAVAKLASFSSEVLAIDGENLLGYDSEAEAWVAKDVVPAMGCTHAPLQNSTTSYESWAVDVGAGYRVVAWNDQSIATGVHVNVYSTATGALVLSQALLNAGSEISAELAHIAVGIVGTVAIVTIAGQLGVYAWQIQLNPLGAWSGGSILTLASYLGNSVYSVAFLSATFVLAWESQSTAGGVTTSALVSRSFNAALSPINTGSTNLGTFTSSGSTYSGIYGLTCMAAQGTDSEAVWVAFHAANYTSGAGSPLNTFVCPLNTTTLFPLSPSNSGIAGTPKVMPMTLGAAPVTRLTVARPPQSTPSVPICLVGANGRYDTTIYPDTTNFAAGGTAYQQIGVSATVSAVQTLFSIFQATQPVYVAALGTHLQYVRQPHRTAPVSSDYPIGQTLQGIYYLVDLQTNLTWSTNTSISTNGGPLPRLLKILAPRIANVPEDAPTTLPGPITNAQYNSPAIVPGASATSFETVMPITRTTGVLGLDLFVIDLTANYRWTPIALGRELYLGGSFYAGGARVVETGFPYRPSLIQASASSGTLTYEYMATFLRIDEAGNVEESAPSDPVWVSGTSSPNVQFQATALTLTQKQRWSDDVGASVTGATPGQTSKVYLALYRTQALQNGDTLHYLVNVQPLPSNQVNSTLASLLPPAAATITDTASDTAISSNATLYTDSGELPHVAPESPTHGCAHKNRIWQIGADQRSIWFSQTYADGQLPAWADANILTIDDAGEPLLALGSLYDKLVAFTRSKFYVIFGDGPSVSGTGSDLQQPQRVPSPVGCLDPRSLVNTPMGLMFQSTRGLELFDSGMNLTFLGEPVSITTALYPVCTSAVYSDVTSTVRFTMTNTAGSLGVIVLYDVRRGRWAVHQLTGLASGPTSFAGAPCLAATVHPVYGYVTGFNASGIGGIIARENTAADGAPWLDYGTYFVPLSVTTAWAKSNDLQGWGHVRRVRLLGTYYDAHGLNATLDYDYVVTGSEVHAFSSATVASFVNGTQEAVRYTPVIGQCSAIRAVFMTTAPTSPQVLGTGQGAGFVGWAIEAHPRRGGYRRQPSSAQS